MDLGWLALILVLGALGFTGYKVYQFLEFRKKEYENQMRLFIVLAKDYEESRNLLRAIAKKMGVKIQPEKGKEKEDSIVKQALNPKIEAKNEKKLSSIGLR